KSSTRLLLLLSLRCHCGLCRPRFDIPRAGSWKHCHGVTFLPRSQTTLMRVYERAVSWPDMPNQFTTSFQRLEVAATKCDGLAGEPSRAGRSIRRFHPANE